MKTPALALLVAFAGPAAAQAPAPAPQPSQAQTSDAPQKPRPALKLNLDEIDPPHSRIQFEPREDKKPPVEQTLPGMGGERTRAWEPPSDKIYPPDTNPNMR